MMNKITSLLPPDLMAYATRTEQQKPYADVLRNGGENYIRCHFVFAVVFGDAIFVIRRRLVYRLHRYRY